MRISYHDIDSYIDRIQGRDIWINEYTVCEFVPNPLAMYRFEGIFRSGTWGDKHTYAVSPLGEFEIPDEQPKPRSRRDASLGR